MYAELLDAPLRITSATAHHAFTSLAYWHGCYYLAYRVAPTHEILPRGAVHVLNSADGQDWILPTPDYWPNSDGHTILAHPVGDVRDPRLVITTRPEALWCFTGVYLPGPQHAHGLANASHWNILWSHATYTRDGKTWAPLTPILRPNTWAWSAVTFVKEGWLVATYDTGSSLTDLTTSITMWHGNNLGQLQAVGIAYDGSASSLLAPQERLSQRYGAAEPLLFQASTDAIGCLLRTERSMLVGLNTLRKPWRWRDTGVLLHPGAIARTRHGLLIAGRGLSSFTPIEEGRPTYYKSWPGLWHLEPDYTCTNLLELEAPGIKDCGYCGLAPDTKPDEWLVSYYSSGGDGLGADVYLARVRITAGPTQRRTSKRRPLCAPIS